MEMTGDQRSLLLGLLVCMLLAGIFCVWLGRLMVRRIGRAWAAYLPLVGFVLFVCLLGNYAVPRLEQMGDIVLPERTVSPEQAAVGTWMMQIGMIAFLTVVVLMRLMDGRLKILLLARDATFRGGIVPERLALVLTLVPMGAMVLILTGNAISSGGGALLILLMGGGMMSAILWKDQSTRLTVDGGTLTLHCLGKDRQYQLSDICDLRWRDCRGVIGKALVIVFRDGSSVWFAMGSFRGVQNTYNELTKKLSKRKER